MVASKMRKAIKAVVVLVHPESKMRKAIKAGSRDGHLESDALITEMSPTVANCRQLWNL